VNTKRGYGVSGVCARKVGEEAVELAVAALDEGDERVVEEAADLVYHLYVLLAARGLDAAAVEDELTRRHARRASPTPPPG
jgi:phosphoribosyl-ATP pyrophosphohydrolase